MVTLKKVSNKRAFVGDSHEELSEYDDAKIKSSSTLTELNRILWTTI